MSQWDGLPEAPPPAGMLGSKGRKGWERVVEAVVAAEKPPTEDQQRAITSARQAMVDAVLTDPEFDPATRVAELEGEIVSHVRALDELLPQLGAWKGAQRWTENVTMPFRAVALMGSRGPAVQNLRRAETVSAVELVSALMEVLAITPQPDERVLVPEFAHNPSKRARVAA